MSKPAGIKINRMIEGQPVRVSGGRTLHPLIKLQGGGFRPDANERLTTAALTIKPVAILVRGPQGKAYRVAIKNMTASALLGITAAAVTVAVVSLLVVRAIHSSNDS